MIHKNMIEVALGIAAASSPSPLKRSKEIEGELWRDTANSPTRKPAGNSYVLSPELSCRFTEGNAQKLLTKR